MVLTAADNDHATDSAVDAIEPTEQPASVNESAATGYQTSTVQSSSQRIVDMRSDTVTKPTAEMRKAMAECEVGDDVFGDDPTVNNLQELAASMLGKEAALFVPSGTMGNLIAVLVHCSERGSEIILGDKSHIFYYEQGGIAQFGGVHPRTVPNQADGTIKLADIEGAIRAYDPHFPITRLICLENTQNLAGGRVLPTEYVHSVAALAKKHNLKLHIDGARFFNAVAATNEKPADMLKGVDSICICLSKGLAAPVGSIVVGNKEFIAKARRLRKALGGGMRQAGVLAACGLISLQQMAKRLNEDHDNAQRLAKALSEVKGFVIDPKLVDTNILYCEIEPSYMSAATFIDKLAQNGVKGLVTTATKFRLVVNYHITADDVEHTIKVVKQIVAAHQK